MKLVAVTGGGQGIGRAIAFYYAKAGYAVSIADTDEEAGEEALDNVTSLGVQAVFVRTDVSSTESVREWMGSDNREARLSGCPYQQCRYCAQCAFS